MTIAAQASEPLDPQVVEAIAEAVNTAVAEALAEAATEANNAAVAEPAAAVAAESSSNLVPLMLGLFGSQAVALLTLLGTIFAAAKWLDGRRLEDKTDTKEEFAKVRDELREMMSWIRWLVAIHVGKPVRDVGAPPDETDLPELADLRREPSAPQAA